MIKRLKKERAALVICLVLSILLHLVYGFESMSQYKALEQQIERQAAQLQDKDYQIEILEIILENREQDASEPLATEPEYIGTFTVTHYCPCEKCCGKTDGITFTGVQAQEGRTVAVDPEVIPLGSVVIIDGQEYIAEDIGGAIKGNRIDKYMESHQDALNAGIVQAEVWIGG
jgi:3D (Asp-Asp-Asp) domain-containing protein